MSINRWLYGVVGLVLLISWLIAVVGNVQSNTCKTGQESAMDIAIVTSIGSDEVALENRLLQCEYRLEKLERLTGHQQGELDEFWHDYMESGK